MVAGNTTVRVVDRTVCAAVARAAGGGWHNNRNSIPATESGLPGYTCLAHCCEYVHARGDGVYHGFSPEIFQVTVETLDAAAGSDKG